MRQPLRCLAVNQGVIAGIGSALIGAGNGEVVRIFFDGIDMPCRTKPRGLQPDRAGARAGTDEDMIREIYIMLVAVCCDLEEQIIDELPPLREREGQFDDDDDDDDDDDEE